MVLPVKEPILLPSCSLYPPEPDQEITTKEKPLGCKTVSIDGFPKSITEEVIREIFDRCGEIQIVRTGEKFFCQVRFALESSVDEAVKLSGYKLEIEDKESSYSNILHVDFAKTRDDEYDYKSMQQYLRKKELHPELFVPPVKESIELFSQSLDSSDDEHIKTKDKPFGCRTVVVKGLPDNVTEEIIREIFDRCGEILVVRMEGRCYGQVRFVSESSVDGAVKLSGSKFKYDKRDGTSHTGRIYVEFAKTPEDEYDYNFACQREALRQRQLESCASNLSPNVPHSDHESNLSGEGIC